jgi:threonine/homoserine/homoserine lactone efflux protein
MTLQLFLALLLFAAVTAYTPGPNNTLLMASGMNHGFKATFPMAMGVALGFPLMIACVGLGLGKLFEIYPIIYKLLKYAGAAYMLWLAWKVANAGPANADNAAYNKPMSFLQMTLFQWINPKGWIMSVTALSTYTIPGSYYTGVASVVGAYVMMGLTSASAWALFGASLRHVMSDPRYYRAINITLALILVASIAAMFYH